MTISAKRAGRATVTAGAVEFKISAARFGYTLHFEFVPAGSTRKYPISMGSVSVNPNSDRFGEMGATCTSMPQYGLSEIALYGAPYASGGNNYGVTIQCVVSGMKRNDVFRVRSEPPSRSISQENLNGDAQVRLTFGGTRLVDIPNGVSVSWMSYRLSTLP